MMHTEVIGALPEPPERQFLPCSPPLPPIPKEAPVFYEHRFEFDGRAGEFFRIWIVNLTLTILTLGLYSAWAKVRTERYFYSNTRLAGVPFEYLAKPWTLFKGRLIAMAFFIAYMLASQFSILWQVILAIVLVLATPWLIVRGMAFRARYSSWRGLNFRLIQDYGEAYIRFLVLLVPLVLSFGLLYPWVYGKQKQFIVESHRYGGSWFSLKISPAQFYIPHLIAWGVMSAWMFIMMMVMAGVMGLSAATGGEEAVAGKGWLIGVIMFLMYAGYFVILAFLSAALINLLYNNVELDGRRMRSTLQGHHLLWIYASNTVGILLSLGLLIPWAMVRIARYRADCTSVIAADDFNDLRAEKRTDVGATAAEMDGLFDIDISL
jgi:uncharacterized membrane protein YjgN (DUF898 family)